MGGIAVPDKADRRRGVGLLVLDDIGRHVQIRFARNLVERNAENVRQTANRTLQIILAILARDARGNGNAVAGHQRL